MERDTAQALADERSTRARSDDEICHRLNDARNDLDAKIGSLSRKLLALEVRIEQLERERRAQ